MRRLIYNHWSEADPKSWPASDFTPSELACRGSGMVIVTQDFLEELQAVRDALKAPMHVTSGCRSAEHNRAVGGHPNSFHICDEDPANRGQRGCLAVDIAAPEGKYRGDLFQIAWLRGWSLGWNAKRGFLHMDRRVAIGWKQTTFDY